MKICLHSYIKYEYEKFTDVDCNFDLTQEALHSLSPEIQIFSMDLSPDIFDEQLPRLTNQQKIKNNDKNYLYPRPKRIESRCLQADRTQRFGPEDH